jgi:DNA-binding NarL/FixJ family response regulator
VTYCSTRTCPRNRQTCGYIPATDGRETGDALSGCSAHRRPATRHRGGGPPSSEHDILDLLAAGLNNRGIAPKTVANNVSSIFTKLQVADRAHAIVRARDAGLGRQ